MVPFIKATQDRVVLEIQRGCIRGCRFCQAGMLYRPTRERDLEMLKTDKLMQMLKATGHEEISLKFFKFQRLFPAGGTGEFPD